MCGRQDGVKHTTPDLAPLQGRERVDFPRACRLDSAGFRLTFDSNEARPGRFFVMWMRRTDGAPGRVGLMATKRIFPRAVDRNRSRRLLREVYRLNRGDLDPSVDLILLARRPMRQAVYGEVAEAFRKICRQARIWRQPS